MTRMNARLDLAGRALAVVVLASLIAGRSEAMEPRALAPFQVQAPDGTSVGTAQVALPGRQVLVYVDASCERCALMLTALEGVTPDELPGLTIVVRGDAGAASRLMDRLPTSLSQVRWFVDRDGTAYTAMKLQSAPIVLGLRAGRIHWARPGPMGDPRALQSAVSSWLGPEAPDRQ